MPHQFVWGMSEKRGLLLEALADLPGLADKKHLSDKLEFALETFLVESAKKLNQTQLEHFHIGVDRSPQIGQKLLRIDLDKMSTDDLARYAEECRSKAQQFDNILRERSGIARRVKV